MSRAPVELGDSWKIKWQQIPSWKASLYKAQDKGYKAWSIILFSYHHVVHLFSSQARAINIEKLKDFFFTEHWLTKPRRVSSKETDASFA